MGDPRAGNIRQGGNQLRRFVQRLRAPQADAVVASKLLKTDVDIVKDFHVVAQEANGLEENFVAALFLEGKQRLFDRGAEPSSSGHSLTLKGELPIFGCEAGSPGYERSGFARMALIRIAFRDR